jgi:hypothetical protein
MLKAGYRTTEFYTTIVTALGMLVSALTNGLNDQTAAKYTGIVSAAYAVSRGLAKVFPPKTEV